MLYSCYTLYNFKYGCKDLEMFGLGGMIMKKVQKGLVAGVLCVSMVASGFGITDIGSHWKQYNAMAEVVDGINIWYGGDVVTNKTITMVVGEQIVLSTESEEKVEWTALDAKVVNVLTASGTVTGMQEGTTTVTVRTESGQAASIRIVVGTPVVSGNFKYVKMSSTTAKIVEYTGIAEKKVTVPAKVDDLQVTHIGYALFGGHTEIETIIFQYGIRSIGEYAMARTALKKVEFPSSVSAISKNCFEQGSVNNIYCTEGSVAEAYAVANGKNYKTQPLVEGEVLGTPITEADTSLETIVPVSAESAVVVLTKENFEKQVHQMQGKLVIDVSTTWCNPCQKMKPYYDQLAKEYQGQVRFASLDGDEYLDLITDCRIPGYPTLLFYEDGKLIGSRTGGMAYEDLEALIRQSFQLDDQTDTENPMITNAPTVTEVPVGTNEPITTEAPKVTQTPNVKITVGKATIKKAVRTSKTKIKVTMKKVSKAKGYKIVYADNANFEKKKTVFTTSTSKVLTGLKKKKTYYIKVYAYKKDRNDKKIYGKVSAVKKVK